MKLYLTHVNPSPWSAPPTLSALSLIVTPARRFHNHVGSFGGRIRVLHRVGPTLPAVGVVLPGDFFGLKSLFEVAPFFSWVVLAGLTACFFSSSLVSAWLTHVPRRHPFVHFQPAILVTYVLWLVAGGLWGWLGLPEVALFGLDFLERFLVALGGYATLFLTTYFRDWYQGTSSSFRFTPIWWFPPTMLAVSLSFNPDQPFAASLMWAYTSFGTQYLVVYFGIGCARLGWDVLSLSEIDPGEGAYVVQRVGIQAAKIGAVGVAGTGAVVAVNSALDRRHQKAMIRMREEGEADRARIREENENNRFLQTLHETQRHNREMERIAELQKVDKSKGWFSLVATPDWPDWSALVFDRDYFIFCGLSWLVSVFLRGLARVAVHGSRPRLARATLTFYGAISSMVRTACLHQADGGSIPPSPINFRLRAATPWCFLSAGSS